MHFPGVERSREGESEALYAHSMKYQWGNCPREEKLWENVSNKLRISGIEKDVFWWSIIWGSLYNKIRVESFGLNISPWHSSIQCGTNSVMEKTHTIHTKFPLRNPFRVGQLGCAIWGLEKEIGLGFSRRNKTHKGEMLAHEEWQNMNS